MPHARRGFPLMPAAALKMLSSPQRTFRWKREPTHFAKQRKCVKMGFPNSGKRSPFSTSKVSCEVSCPHPLHPAGAACGRTPLPKHRRSFICTIPTEITNPSDRCVVPLQPWSAAKDVAAMVGIEEWLYQDLESGNFRRSFSRDCGQAGCLLFHPGQRPSG